MFLYDKISLYIYIQIIVFVEVDFGLFTLYLLPLYDMLKNYLCLFSAKLWEFSRHR